VLAGTFDESNSPDLYDFARLVLRTPPGNYTLRVLTRDLESGKSFRREGALRLEDFRRKQIAISDVIMVRRRVDSPPEVSDVIFTGLKSLALRADEMFAYFEVISSVDSSVYIESEIFNRREERVFSGSYRRTLKGGRLRECLRIGSEKLGLGAYSLKITAIADRERDEVEKSFRIRSLGSLSGGKLDLAIRQLIYATDRGTVERMLKAPSEERKRLFEEFWKERDPTPDTPENELMDEYYGRISYANEHFVSSTGKEGWETDMGAVYVIYGPPDEIYSQPFADRNQRPYQIWYYYRIGRKFVFVEFMGFGEYLLVSADFIG